MILVDVSAFGKITYHSKKIFLGLFSLLKNTHKFYIEMRNTQENWVIIAKHGNHLCTAQWACE